jgi:thiol-disulfide isomerase/thioredoxin
MQKFALLCLLPVLFTACIEADKTYTRVAPGMWRGVLELEHFSLPAKKKDDVAIVYDQFKPGELPFNFEVKYVDNERFYIEIFNGKERIRLDSIQYGRDRTQARDTMNVWFPEYQSYIHAEIRGGVMQGYWKVTSKEDYKIPFYAHAGRDYRFTTMQRAPLRDITGSWATTFGVDGKPEDMEKAVGEFKQEGNHLEGTFRTESGDYRFLEGTVQDRKFWLSTFDGAHAYLFSGSIQGDTLQGEFRSGHKYKSLWMSWKDPNFDLGAADTLTRVKAGAKISFSVKTPEGQDITFPSNAFDGKIKIFSIMGTWCPNCRDELVFLTRFLKENPELAKQMTVIGFSFERDKDVAKANQHLAEYKKKLGIPFDIVYAGKAGAAEAAKFFPVLDKVMAFPTMMILDKNNQIVQVHTGFDGPATSRYEGFKQEFQKKIAELTVDF